jgi:DNA methylase
VVEQSAQSFDDLYGKPIPSTRRGSIFNAHSYPTKINPATIVACIMAHTGPDDLVFDGFAGSGATLSSLLSWEDACLSYQGHLSPLMSFVLSIKLLPTESQTY